MHMHILSRGPTTDPTLWNYIPLFNIPAQIPTTHFASIAFLSLINSHMHINPSLLGLQLAAHLPLASTSQPPPPLSPESAHQGAYTALDRPIFTYIPSQTSYSYFSFTTPVLSRSDELHQFPAAIARGAREPTCRSTRPHLAPPLTCLS